MHPAPILTPEASLLLGLFTLMLIVNCMGATFFFYRQFHKGDLVLKMSQSLVPPLSAPLWTGVLAVASIFCSAIFRNQSFYLIFALIPVTTLVWNRIRPFEFWNIRFRDSLNYLATSLWILFVILAPLCILSLGCSLLFKKLGINSLQPAVDLLLGSKNPKVLAQFLIYAVIIAPILEEVGFRGFLYPLFKSKFGRNRAMIATAFLFGLAHLHAPTFLPLFILGLILAYYYESTGSLAYPITLHGLFNAVNCLVLVILKPYMPV